MAGINAQINLIDSLTGPMQRMIQTTERLVSHINSVEGAMNEGFDPYVIEDARHQAEVFAGQINEVSSRINSAEAEQESFNSAVHQGHSAMEGLVGKAMALAGAYLSVNAVVGKIKDFAEAYNTQREAETKLETVMRQRMGAAEAEIDSVKKLASAQQELGVVGDEVQLAGAQQLSTFLSSSDSLKSLIPAMNNLAVQQNGVSVSGGDMVNIGNMMGKVMQGQVGALTRVGITFSEAQEEILKYGTESEKAATLAQVITDNVGNMNEAMAATPAGQIQQVTNTLGDMKEVAGEALMPPLLRLFDAIKANAPLIQDVILSAGAALGGVIDMLLAAAGVVGDVCAFISDNWSVIEPVIIGIAGAVGFYNSVMLVSKGIEWAVASVKAIHKGITMAMATASRIAAASQQGFNAALLACPLTWIIGLIIAVIAAIYAVVAGINKATGSTISATGIIMGALASAVAFIWNLFLGLLELVLGVINALINPFINFANFIGNVFTSPISSIIYMFQGMADGVLAILESIASALDFVFGSSMADTVGSWRSGLKDMADAAVAEYAPNENYQKVMDSLDLSAEGLGLKRWAYTDAWNKGYKLGEDIEDGVGDLFGKLMNPEDSLGKLNDSTANVPGNVPADIADTAKNTKKSADSLDISGEDLKYLKDIAERDAVNRFTTAEIKIDMTNHNNVSSGTDLDGLVSDLAEKAGEALNKAAEGVHK